ncbi:MAG: ATP-dependent RecD-like DNA helicase, partial [Candidatus Hydrogenedentes bacterium]|nr:ATP-dependent RecD-like DNA helicase [Candidatus Hydrogenedentota bacterium]
MADRKDERKTERTEITLNGEVDKVVYANEASGYVVARVRVVGEKDLVTVVGTLMALAPGEKVEMHGEWTVNKKFGRQFQVERYRTLMPSSLYGIAKYLGSGLIKGIGPVMARRLVDEFGEDTIDVIENHPEQLARVEGIGKKRVGMIRDAWVKHRAVHDVMIFLQTHGISPAYAAKIYKTYGESSAVIVQQNPYRLAEDIFGIGFATADRIAQRLGTPTDAPARISAGVLHVLGEMGNSGHVYCPRRELVSAAAKLLKVDPEGVDDTITTLDTLHRVHVEDEKVYLERRLDEEKLVAGRLTGLLHSPKTPVSIDMDRAIQWIEKRFKISLADAQKDALHKVYNSKVLVVTGGPGTGKTALVRAISEIYTFK